MVLAGREGAASALARRTWSDAFGHSVTPDELAVELAATRSESYFADALQDETILVAETDGALLGYVQFGDVNIREVDVRPGTRRFTAFTSRPGCRDEASAGG